MSIRKTNTSHFKSGNVSVNSSVLNTLVFPGSKKWKDSNVTTKKINGKEVFTDRSVMHVIAQVDTFSLINERSDSHEYLVSGTTLTQILSISNNADSLAYSITGIFCDTVHVKNKENYDAEKLAYYIIEKVLYETIHKEILKEFKKVANQ